ncbi:Soluble guanylate cyclase 88E [Triplophysa tibetana]|uniref:guanylate cyclase n=1 Tax=Triplophysa tibetana TaxID=1572043 RepID=A0A5A9N2F4_9TELE|nr:Soluble guanylate cyclase 88E [Triplophysa tibetana]
MIKIGVYVNDLNLHDSSRELILARTQQSSKLQLALEQEQQKFAQLQEIIKKLDEEKKRGDSLLYAMIPKAGADRLRKGITALETCQVFSDVTILFSDVVSLNEICIPITPMQVVEMLNEINIVFDTLSEKHKVYKGKKDLSFKTPAALRYSNEQKDSDDRSSNSSTCTNSKHSPSDMNTPNEEQAEGKRTPSDIPQDTLQPLEDASDPTIFITESQEKEKVKKTKNDKGGKADNASGNAQESTSHVGGPGNVAPELNKRKYSFRSQYARLPGNFPMINTACSLLCNPILERFV